MWELIEGKEIVLVSQTMDLIARTVARHIGAKAYYAMQNKEEVLVHFTDFDIITDNMSDIELIKRAQHATIVTYNNKPRWEKILPQGINVTFIETGKQLGCHKIVSTFRAQVINYKQFTVVKIIIDAAKLLFGLGIKGILTQHGK